jgi:predicted MFS family arabinose efflux permease
MPSSVDADEVEPQRSPSHASAVAEPVERDFQIILVVQALRAFAYGFASVVLGASLARGGLSDLEVGFVFTAMLAGTALVSIVVGLTGDRVGRRRAYRVLLVALGLAGAAYAFAESLIVLIPVALTGTLSTDANESGPITSLEQAMLGGAPAATRARVFGRYNAVAYLAGAAGALAAGGPGVLRGFVPALPEDQRWLLLFPVIALACLVLARRLSVAVEAPRAATGRALERSRRDVGKLSALFGLDAFAGGFVVTTFVVYWFESRLGAGVGTMSLVVSAGGLIQAGSSIASGRLGTRFGLLNTMVFTHLPSDVLLVLVPFMPSLGWAIAVLLLRFTLSQMDVPARQAFVVALVDPEERTAASAFTNTARYVARPFGAVSAGVMLQSVALAAPFVAAGALKMVYDVAIYLSFRRVPLAEDVSTPLPPPER